MTEQAVQWEVLLPACTLADVTSEKGAERFRIIEPYIGKKIRYNGRITKLKFTLPGLGKLHIGNGDESIPGDIKAQFEIETRPPP